MQKTSPQLVERPPNGARFRFEHSQLECLFLAWDIIRISWTPGKPPPPCALDPHAALNEPVEIEIQEKDAGWKLSGEVLEVTVSGAGALAFWDSKGELLKGDEPPVRQRSSWTLTSPLQPGESLHGLGLRAAPLKLNPGSYKMWHRDPGGTYGPGDDPLYLCIPVMLARNRNGAYLLFFENSFEALFTFEENPPESRITFFDGMLRYYFIAGDPARSLSRYTSLTGRPPLPPRWALGFHQSRWGYTGRKEVAELVSGFKEHDLPLSAVHLDIDHMRGYRVFTVHGGRFPRLEQLASDLGQEGMRLVSIVDPGVKRESAFPLYREGKDKDLFCKGPDNKEVTARVWPGRCVFPDFTREDVRGWWSQKYGALLDRGVSGFWHDMNEPATFEDELGHTLPPDTIHGLDGNAGDHREAHNLYGLLMAQAGFEGVFRHAPQRRPWILSRSGWAGLQRYAWNWTGDVETSWEALRQTVASVLNLGLSGIPFTGPDIGGFSGSPSRELFVRWFQMAAFLPLFRVHCAWNTARREPWLFGPKALDIVRELLKLRYALLPYLYTLAYQASQTGHPLVRPLFWSFPDDPAAEAQDAFLLGESLMIAPVLEPEAKVRETVLPQASWYHFWDDRMLQGPGRVALPAALERIPVFVRSATVLPMEKEKRLELHIYAPLPKEAPTASELYSDAGDGYGPSRLDQFALRRRMSTLEVVWQSQGRYPFPWKDVTVRVHGAVPKACRADGQWVPISQKEMKTGPFARLEIDLLESEPPPIPCL